MTEEAGGVEECAGAKRQKGIRGVGGDEVPWSVKHFRRGVDAGARERWAEMWPAGEAVGRRALEEFVGRRIGAYKSMRDIPSEVGTSMLSHHLAVGSVSARQCVAAACEANGGRLHRGSEGIDGWIEEIVWREFYKHLLVGYPRLSKGRAFKEETERIEWSDDEGHFDAWCEGRTGYPIVDAAQRQLLDVGWMHNRLRMISAMFLTKHLLTDWRKGERWFMRHLIDGDLASNNGGWQWSASTGTDAQPYFRVFNPTTQSERFDPDGAFIRRYVPELADVEGKAIHEPTRAGLFEKLDYPEPIVEHKKARARAIEVFKALKE